MGYDLYLILRTLALPPACLLLLLLLGLVLLAMRRRWLGAVATVTATVALIALSTPVVGRALWTPLITHVPLERPVSSDRCQAIVVLGGGLAIAAPEWGSDTVGTASLARLRYGIALARESGLSIALTGGSPVPSEIPEAEAMRRVAEGEFGHPIKWIEDRSRNTAENASLTHALLSPVGITRICLVTHAEHMGRAETAFLGAGFAVVPAPIGLPGTAAPHMRDYLPTAGGLSLSSRAATEWLGRAWYWLRRQSGGNQEDEGLS